MRSLGLSQYAENKLCKMMQARISLTMINQYIEDSKLFKLLGLCRLYRPMCGDNAIHRVEINVSTELFKCHAVAT